MTHKPVLVNEVLGYLAPKSNENFIDGTVGNGGHANLILEAIAPFGKLVGIDADAQQITHARRAAEKFNERIILVNDSYANLKEIVQRVRVHPVDGILLDLGYSSWHVDESGKGFSFKKEEILDMRYGLAAQAGRGELTAARIVNEWPERELENIFSKYGEEKFARQIAKAIVRQRKSKKIETTSELINVIGVAIPEKFKHGGIHYATRIFQALRIVVNAELDNLQKFLPQAVDLLASGGRLAVISFHSLEDRIVKQFFKEQEQKGAVTILTKKPVEASDLEVAENPRSRSAKLRAIVKI